MPWLKTTGVPLGSPCSMYVNSTPLGKSTLFMSNDMSVTPQFECRRGLSGFLALQFLRAPGPPFIQGAFRFPRLALGDERIGERAVAKPDRGLRHRPREHVALRVA